MLLCVIIVPEEGLRRSIIGRVRWMMLMIIIIMIITVVVIMCMIMVVVVVIILVLVMSVVSNVMDGVWWIWLNHGSVVQVANGGVDFDPAIRV